VNQSDLKDKINSLLKMIDDSVESVQKISGKLRPGILDELGLVSAIEWQTEEFEKTTSIKCSLVLPKDEIVLDENKSTALFRIFQESLTNIARHSNASRVSVNLLKSKQHVILEIRDDGIGITKEQIKDVKSLGIHGMRERAIVLGGEINIEGFPGKGTLIKAVIPADEVKNE
ncbi:sensor histidine kinase, partial [Schleiferia thermophila]